MTTSRWTITAQGAVRAVLIVGFLVALGAALPGHLSNDSVRQLHEAHLGQRETWGPVVYAAILGGFDRLVPGSGLYVVASFALLFASFWAMTSLRDRVSWAAPAVALGIVLTPALMIYQGIVWKDVLYANLAVASFVLLAHIARVWDRPGRPWLALLGLLLALAIAAQVRQNGLIAAAVAALVMAWTARDGGWRATLGWGVGGLVAVLLVSQGLAVATTPKVSASGAFGHQGLRTLQQYDILGTLAHDRRLRLTVIGAANPGVERTILLRAVPLYAPERVDYIHLDPVADFALGSQSDAIIDAQWRELVLDHPSAYLAHRLDVFRAVFLTPMIDSCLPLFVGVDGPPSALADMRLAAAVDPADQSLYNYGTFFLDTPVFSHLSYALIAVGVVVALMLRRDPQDIAMVGLMLASLGFAASFALISIACDYRYIYALDLGALAGLLYLAVDPPLPRGARR